MIHDFFYISIVTTSGGGRIQTLVLLIKESGQCHWATRLLAPKWYTMRSPQLSYNLNTTYKKGSPSVFWFITKRTAKLRMCNSKFSKMNGLSSDRNASDQSTISSRWDSPIEVRYYNINNDFYAFPFISNILEMIFKMILII